MSSDALRKAVDRMVEDAIRRILPGVMNEILLKTIAGSGIIAEGQSKPTRKKKSGPKPKAKAQRVVEQRKPARQGPRDLSDLLDETAGAEFYEDPRARQVQVKEDIDEPRPQIASRIQSLPPELRTLAEDIDLDDDGAGEMWEDESTVTLKGDDAGPLDIAAKKAGISFGRMKTVLGETARKVPATRRDPSEVAFEERRLKLARDKLERPVG